METIAQTIAQELSVQSSRILSAIELLDGGATVPFIARYRKEATGGLDDTQLRMLEERLTYLRELSERQATIIASIKDQGKLTPELHATILSTTTKIRLEDLYLPFKPRKVTKGQLAIEAGLLPLADLLYNDPSVLPSEAAKPFITNVESDIPENQRIKDETEALEGAKYILMERLAENAELIHCLRSHIEEHGWLHAQVIKEQESVKKAQKFRDYFSHIEKLLTTPSHRALAMFRGRKEGVLSLRIRLDKNMEEKADFSSCESIIATIGNIKPSGGAADKWLNEVIKWTWRVKLQGRLESELLSQLRERSEHEAIAVFSRNLKDMLMAAPAGPKVTMGLDPGIRTGVKVGIISATGKLLAHTTIYPHAPKNEWDQSIETLKLLCEQHHVELIGIGNGTASRETDQLISDLKKRFDHLAFTKVMVNEAGASIYSASEAAANEFPDLDVTLRGAVSIARRLQDPLAELVKIDPRSIGVGQYQHDVSQTKLAKSLDAAVEDCVNAVGVDVNTASTPLLARIAGLNTTIAQNMVNYREANGAFNCRQDFTKVPRLGARTFEQAAGFLRIMDSDNPLDRSAVHPEQYPTVIKIAERSSKSVQQLIGDKGFLQSLELAPFVTGSIGLPTLQDIVNELEKPARDPRPAFKTAIFKEGVSTIEDVQPNMLLEGVVTNVANFGAFVDIGVHQDGLVHLSQLTNRYIKSPSEVVKAGDIVKVKVLEVDTERKRIGLTMKIDQAAPTNNQRKAKQSRSTRPKTKTSVYQGTSKPHARQNARSTEQPTLATLFAKAKPMRKK